MPKIDNWQLRFAFILIIVSALVYTLHFFIFKDAHHIFFGLVEEIAFVPIHVLLITLIIEKLLSVREKQSTVKKLRIIVGVFFSDFGNDLLKTLPKFDESPGKITKELLINENWSDEQFLEVRNLILKNNFHINSFAGNLTELSDMLAGHRDMLIRLLENPSLMEFETFTELVLALFHLNDELSQRDNLELLPASDIEHIDQDIERAYVVLIIEWIRHMHYLKREHPFMFSLAVRLNPFNPNASPTVKA